MASKSSVTEKCVAYYRVSTQGQGQSGLGLEDQKQKVYNRFGKLNIAAEYVEIESGRTAKRPELSKAIAYAQQNHVKLVIAKLDRLSRSVSFIFALKESGVQFAVVDLPDLNTLNLGIFATVAQYEAEVISSRTKAALAVKKSQGFKLGNPKNLDAAARLRSGVVRTETAREQPANKKAYLIIKDLQGSLSLRAIAKKLNAYGLKTVKGKQFEAQQVKNILALYQGATNAN